MIALYRFGDILCSNFSVDSGVKVAFLVYTEEALNASEVAQNLWTVGLLVYQHSTVEGKEVILDKFANLGN